MSERAPVTLREVTAKTVVAICSLKVAPSQVGFVAPNSWSIAEAHFSQSAWFRAIYAGDEPVGFIMLELDVEKPHYSLWRLMVADGHQRLGYGKRALEFAIEHVKTLPGADALLTSYVEGELGPEHFYKGLGFVDTGAIEDGEVVCRLELTSG